MNQSINKEPVGCDAQLTATQVWKEKCIGGIVREMFGGLLSGGNVQWQCLAIVLRGEVWIKYLGNCPGGISGGK